MVDLGISDHSLVFIRREKTKIEKKGRIVKCRCYKNFNNEAFLEDLGSSNPGLMSSIVRT